MSLNKDQVTRFSRHLLLSEVGRAGQEKLSEASVLLVGMGGLGCPAAQYLAAAGVGTLGLADGDEVDLTNLQRQVLHWEKDLGRPKTESAREKLAGMNSAMTIREHGRLDPENIEAVLEDYDLVLDGSDNFPTKFLVNDACVKTATDFIYGGILRFEGQWMSVRPGKGACFRCVFLEAPPEGSVPNCAEAGVLGAVAGSVGSLMAVEALKLLAGLGQPCVDRLVTFDALKMNFREVAVKRNPACPACGSGEALEPLKLEGGTAACAPGA